MNKQDFIDKIAAEFPSRRAAEKAVDAVLDGIAEILASGGEINFTGFGKFSVTERGPRQGVNPRTGAHITIASGRVPRFSAGGSLKEGVRQSSRPGDPDEEY